MSGSDLTDETLRRRNLNRRRREGCTSGARPGRFLLSLGGSHASLSSPRFGMKQTPVRNGTIDCGRRNEGEGARSRNGIETDIGTSAKHAPKRRRRKEHPLGRAASEGVFFPAHRAQRNLRTVVSWAPLRRFWSLRRQRACDGTRAPGRPTPSRRARRAGRARFGASADRRRSRPSSLFGDTRLRSARGAPDSRC